MKQSVKQNNGQFKDKPSSSISTWPSMDLLNQIITPVPTLTNNDLQQELDFFANAQFKYSTNQNSISAISTESNSNYLDLSNLDGQSQARSFRSQSEAFGHEHALRSLAMALDQQQRRSSAHMDALLSHEPSMLPQDTNLHGHQINPLYSNNSVSPSTTSNQSVHGLSPFNPKLVGCTDQIDTVLPSTSNFSKETASVEPKGTRKTSRNKQQQTQFRFKSNQSVKSNHKTAQSDLENKQKPLDINMLSQHNMQQEMTATRTITLGDTTFTFTIDSLLNTSKRKGKQKEHTPRRLSKIDLEDGMDEDDEYDEYDHQGSDKDEEEPFIGDGALSFSSIGSGNSYNSQKKSRLTKDDKRRRNTAASARFRIKKKMKEQALQKTAYDMTEKAQAMEHKVHELEREIKWLKALVVEKNESTLEELIRERPPNSIAFPLTSASNTSHQYDNQNIGKEDGYYSPC